MTSKTSKKSTKVANKAAPKRTAAKAAKASKAAPKRGAAKAAKPRKSAAKSSDPAAASKRIEQKIAELDDWRGERLAEIRALIHEVDPEVVEEWKWMGTPVWSHEGMYVLANAHKDKVKITFFHGAQLADPQKLFNAGLNGNKWRAIDLREEDEIDKPGLAALLREAIAYNASHSVPKSKGSRAKKVAKKTAKKAAAKRAVATPTLLTGGNPQIAKGDGDAPVQAYLAAMPGWKRDLGRRLDALVVRTVPGVRKAVKWNSPFYGVEGQGWFLSFHCFTKYVKVTFFRGTSLRPVPPGASKNQDTRYLDIREHDELDEALVASWIRQASELPGWTP